MRASRAVSVVVLCGLLAGIAGVVSNASTVGATPAPQAGSPAVAAAAVQQNLLLNGSFETGGASLSPWIFRHDIAAGLAVDTGGVADGTRAARVTVSATSASTHLG